MDSGLDLDEDMSGFDLSTQLVYLDDDIAAAAAQAPLKTTPATRWHYSGASTHLLADGVLDVEAVPVPRDR